MARNEKPDHGILLDLIQGAEAYSSEPGRAVPTMFRRLWGCSLKSCGVPTPRKTLLEK